MIPLFIALTFVNLLGLATAAALGYMGIARPTGSEFHTIAGTLAAVTCCAVHCAVMTYFMATSKWAWHAVQFKQLDNRLITSRQRPRALAFFAALIAMAVVFAAVILGVISDSYRTSPALHHLAALIAIAINAAMAMVEYHSIERNQSMIQSILDQIKTPTVQSRQQT